MLFAKQFVLYRFLSARSYQKIGANEFTERRAKLLELLKSANNIGRDIFILLLSHPKTFNAPDVTHIYRQCSYFHYLSGVDQPQCRLLIGPSESVLFIEVQNEHQILWDGPTHNSQKLQEVSGIKQILPLEEFDSYIAKTFRNCIIATDINSVANIAMRNQDLKKFYYMLSNGVWTHISLNESIDKLRWKKSIAEQNLMRETCRIGAESINAVFRECRTMCNESHIVGFLEQQCRWRGAKGLAYPPVVAGGNNANTIHYISSNKVIRQTDCVLVDAGCDLEGYISDITRCFPISGVYTSNQKTLYDALNYVHNQLLNYVQNIRPLRLNELYHFMLEQMAKNLGSIVFFQRNFSEKELIKQCDILCPHHVSHYLGLDVHDSPSIPRIIDCQPGVIITIEPGIYIRPENPVVRKEFKGIGFRIEDDVLLTDSGAEILTSKCIRTSDEIEFEMTI